MNLKAGIKTTEFWLSVIALLVGVFLASGVLPAEHWAVRIAGALAAALAALGYSRSRGIAKGGASCLLVLILALGANGCCSTARCYLARAQTALAATDSIMIEVTRKICVDKIVAAKCSGDPEKCEPFVRCRAALLGYRAARVTAGRALVEANKALYEADVP